MARPLVCDLCEDSEDTVVFMVTRTDNGETITLGAGCAGPWARALADNLLGPSDQTETEVGDATDETESDTPDSSVADPTPKSNGKGRRPTHAPTEEVEAEAAATAD